MIATVKRYPLIAVLTVAGIVLAAIVVYEAVSASMHSQLSSAGSQAVAPVQSKLLPPMPVTVAEAYPETVARPLLTPNRRPAPEKAAAGPASSMQKGRYTLTGVTIVGPLRIALLREKSSGRVVRAEQGKEIEGVTVAQIEPESVTLALGGDQETISLQVQKGTATAAVAPAAGPFAMPAGQQPPSAEAPIPPGQNPAQRAPVPAPGAFGPGTAPGPAGAPPPAAPASAFGPAPAPAGQAAPLTPEELLARRRARRTQQSQ